MDLNLYFKVTYEYSELVGIPRCRSTVELEDTA